jgi:hypothetical protein
MQHINKLCGKNIDLLSAKPGGTDSNHCALKSQFYDGLFILRAIVAWLDAGLFGNPT